LLKRVAQKSGELWFNVPQSGRDQLKQALLDITLTQPFKIFHPSAPRVIAAIAFID
ncbi:hypothetical protein DFH11DRAFT_1467070, partial [Phellopilus nigrolimitatus]